MADNDDQDPDKIVDPDNPDGDGEPKIDEPKGPFKPMGIDVVKKALSKLARTYDGLSYAYIVLKIPQEQEYDDLPEELINYVHIRDIDMSKNKFTHIRPLRIDCNTNEIKDMDIFGNPEMMQFLQTINLSINKIRELPKMCLSSLLELNLDQNEIKTAENFTGLPNLGILRMRNNKLKNCNGLANMPKLTELYLTENLLTTMRGLENLPMLRKLNVKKNNINIIDFCPDLPEMQIFNIKENQIASLKEIKTIKFPKIKSFNVLGNPGADEAGASLKTDCLIYMEDYNLEKLNKDMLEKADFEEAKAAKVEKLKKDEEDRIEAERLQKEKEEQERIEKEEQDKIQKEKDEEERKLKEEEDEKLKQEEELKKEMGDLNEQPIDTGNNNMDMDGGDMGGDMQDDNMDA